VIALPSAAGRGRLRPNARPPRTANPLLSLRAKKTSGNKPTTGTVDLSKLESMNKKIGSLYNISAKLNEEVAKTKVSPELESVISIAL
jgi:hypothetical protein